MEKVKVNGVDVEINTSAVTTFLNNIEYPIVIFDFETFRNLLNKKNYSSYANDFEKIFSLAFLIINKKEDLSFENLQNKKLCLFAKILIPKPEFLKDNVEFLKYQHYFFKFLVIKLLKYHVKSLVVLGARTETLILKNYLAYHIDKSKFKNKISYFFHNNKIFDLYDIWDNDNMLNLPLYKKRLYQNTGATKKTWMLIKRNDKYLKVLKPHSSLTNNDIGRIIDQYFLNNICLLPSFSEQVANHNQNDVLVTAIILSLLYDLSSKIDVI